MSTTSTLTRPDRRTPPADPQAVRAAVQASMDRRDNGGETGHADA